MSHQRCRRCLVALRAAHVVPADVRVLRGFGAAQEPQRRRRGGQRGRRRHGGNGNGKGATKLSHAAGGSATEVAQMM